MYLQCLDDPTMSGEVPCEHSPGDSRREDRQPVIRLDPHLSVEAHIVILEAVNLALSGKIVGCCCGAEGKIMPCAHALAVARNPYLPAILREALELAEEGVLNGCDCVAENKPMPCEHVLEFADDPAIPLILRIEQQRGKTDRKNIALAAERLAADPRHSKEYKPSVRPTQTTDTEPGSKEKKKVIRKRISKGESVGREGDRYHKPSRMRGEGQVGADWREEEDYYGD